MEEYIHTVLLETTKHIKHSSATFKKTKDKIIHFEKKQLIPSEKLKAWVQERNIMTLSDFFDFIFSNAASDNRLDYLNKTITFTSDAELFGFVEGLPISIYTLFENIPNYFQ